ncbi:TonB-dependent receptor [Novosphingobium mangrovi (ex Huang et al. 2023)]|uniref:TonB-dependent receptor n=1 Tax=Novosphingobium mangrovi (ex Huang et al. 2023) TaxID=2976432 RepID=A0ABT2I435_9SPHN|nr:TonB-dependent receptor [Novosphingobium mangrovi (ex Huang et al. 2023)]MCT2399550.1 TonB-dependent receptor [Novosphingobium mangrovi (ex Huang et al. 2023)]
MTYQKKMRAGLLCATIFTNVALAMPALAQAGPDDGYGDGGAIIVSATRRDTTLIETPINISAIGSEQLANEHIDDMRDLGAFTPGLTVLDNGPRSSGTVVMRGLSADDTEADGGDNSNTAIGMYLGEVPMYYDFKLIDVSRVEVLLGPQGTLYGLGTLAGAMRYMPNRPDPTQFTVEASGRVFDMAHSGDVGYSGYATLNIPLAEKIAFRTTTGYYDTPGFIDYPYLLQTPGVSLPQPGTLDNPLGTDQDKADNFKSAKDVNYDRTFTSRNQLGFVDDDFQIFVTYAYQKTKTGGRQANGGGVVGEGKYEAPWRYLEPATREGQLLSLEATGNVADFMDVVFVSAYTQRKTSYRGDNTDLLIDLDYDYELFPAFSSFNQSHQKEHEYTNELRLVSTFESPLSFVAGAFWNRMNYRSDYDEYVPGFPEWANEPENWGTDFITDHSNPEYAHEYSSYVINKNDEKGLYGEATWHFTDDIQLTGGLRYYKYSAYVDGGSFLPLYGGTYSTRSGSTSDDGLVYKINASWNITPDFMVYGTYSTGYRIGGVNRVAPCSQPVIDKYNAGQPQDGQTLCALPHELFYGPDKVKNAEIGFRGQLFDKKLSFSLSAYHVDWNGIQLSGQTVYGAMGITVNGGKAVSKGIDFSFNANPFPGFNLRGNYSYLDAHLTEDVPMLLSVAGGDLVDVYSDGRLPGSAKNSGALGATYEFPVGLNSVMLGWTSTYTGGIYTRVGLLGGGERLPSYTMHRATVTYKAENYEVSLFANNIFDKYAVTGVGSDLTRKGLVNDGVISRYYARSVATPRVIGLEARIKY